MMHCNDQLYLPGDNGIGIVLIHGISSGCAQMIPLGKMLNDYGYSVHCVNIAGHGTYPQELLRTSFEAGKREFKEECGATADSYFSLGEVYPSPGYCGEIIHLYGAAGLHFGQQHLDEGEYLDVVRMPLDEAVRRVMTGEIKDAKTAIAILKLKERINP